MIPQVRTVTALVLLSIMVGSAKSKVIVATAHDPQLENRNFWPEETKNTTYYKETWPKGRLLIWGYPGSRDRNIDPTDPKNWLQDGKPADILFGGDTDILFPDADTPYNVSVKGGIFTVRHITVGKNARVSLQKLTVSGNVWIKNNGRISWLEELSGDKHSFARNDNQDQANIRIANKLTISKSGGASVEIVGRFETSDDLNLNSGTMIIGPDSTFMSGDRSVQGIFPDAYEKEEPAELKALPRKIDMVLLGDVHLKGVVFDNVLKGGILLPDPGIRSKWQNVLYGDHNAAEPGELYQRYQGTTDFKLKG